MFRLRVRLAAEEVTRLRPWVEDGVLWTKSGIWTTWRRVNETHFYHAAVTEPLVHDLIVVVEVSSPTAKKVPVQSHNSFLDQRSQKVIV